MYVCNFKSIKQYHKMGFWFKNSEIKKAIGRFAVQSCRLALLAAISFSASKTGHPQRGQAASPDMAFADLLLGMNSVLWTNYIYKWYST